MKAIARVRCHGHMHRIQLDSRGCIGLLDPHAAEEAVLLAVQGETCRCREVIETIAFAVRHGGSIIADVPAPLQTIVHKLRTRLLHCRQLGRGNTWFAEQPPFLVRAENMVAALAHKTIQLRGSSEVYVERGAHANVERREDTTWETYGKKSWPRTNVWLKLTLNTRWLRVHREGLASVRGTDRKIWWVLDMWTTDNGRLRAFAARDGRGYNFEKSTGVLEQTSRGWVFVPGGVS